MLDDACAYRRFRVAPQPGGGLTWARAAHESPDGRIESAWRLAGDELHLRILLPAGTGADGVLPDGGMHAAGPGNTLHQRCIQLRADGADRPVNASGNAKKARSSMEWTGPVRFLPPPEPARREDGSVLYSGLTYAAVPGYRPLQLDVRAPAAGTPPPLVVWIHGGAWQNGDRRYLPETLRPNQLFDALLAAGLAVATIDYRHAREAVFPAQLHDAKAAIRYLRAHADPLGVDVERIGIWGESAGGHLAALVALTAHRPDLEGRIGVLGPSSAVDAVVDWYGVSDVNAMPPPGFAPEIAAKLPPETLEDPLDVLLRGVNATARADASPNTHITADAPPFLLIHGTADQVVPYSQSEQLEKGLSAAGVPARLVPVDGADHIFLGCDEVDAIVDLSVGYLADALRKDRG